MGWKRTEDLTDAEVSAYLKDCWQSDIEPTRKDIHSQRMMWIVGGECDCASWMRPDRVSVQSHSLPHYSTNIADAWRVVEKLINEGWCVSLINDDNGHWALTDEGMQNVPDHWAKDDEPDDIVTTFFIGKELWADTPSLAICRAALMAIGTYEEDE